MNDRLNARNTEAIHQMMLDAMKRLAVVENRLVELNAAFRAQTDRYDMLDQQLRVLNALKLGHGPSVIEG